MNDIREILKLVVEHKAMRKLYSINGIDNSLINKLIVEEVLAENDDEEVDQTLKDINSVFDELNPTTPPKEQLVSMLMLKGQLSKVMAQYEEKKNAKKDGYDEEGLKRLQAMMNSFNQIYEKLGLDTLSVDPDETQIKTKINDLGDKLSDKAVEATVKGIEKNFKRAIDQTMSKIRSTDAKQKTSDTTEKTQLIIKNLRAYSRRVDSFISFMEKFKTNVETKFEKDLDKRQVLVDILKSIESQLPTAKAAKEEIEDIINDVAEIRRGMLKEGNGKFKGIFGDDFFTELEGFEEIGERIKNIETNIGEIQKAFNEKIKEPALEKESYTIQKKGIDDGSGSSDTLPVTAPQIDDFLETFAQLMAFPEDTKGIEFISFKDFAKAVGIIRNFKDLKNDPRGKIGKAFSKVGTSVLSALREDDEKRHGLKLKDIGLEGDGVAQVSNDDQQKKIIKKIMQEIEPYKEELVLAMIEAYASTATAANREPPDQNDPSFNPDDLDTYNASAAGSYFNNVDGNADIKNKAPDADMRFLRPFKKMNIFKYLNFLGQNETSLRGIQFDIYAKVQKKKINGSILKDLAELFKQKNVLENNKFESFTKSLFSTEKDLEECLKPVIQKIMESWRRSALREQGEAHSNDWLSSINVGQFISALESDDNKVLNPKAIERGINAAMKRYAKEIKALEGEEKSKFDALVSKAMSADTVDALADFAVEQAEDATKLVGATVGAKAGAAAGTIFGPAGTIAGGLFGAAAGWAASKLVGATAKKGIQIAQNIGGALEDLDVEDQELGSTPAYNLIDISDDYKKVIVGADGELDKKEAAVLAIGFKRVAEAYNKIQQKLATVEAMPQDSAQDLMNYLNAFSDLMDEPMSNYMSNTATEATRKAYSKMLGLQRNVTINQN